MKALLIPAAAALLLTAGACQSTGNADLRPTLLQSRAVEAAATLGQEDSEDQEDGPSDEGVPAESSDGEADESKSPREWLDDAIEAKVLSDQERAYKEAEVEIARLEREAEEIEINESLRQKREALKAAREDLVRFEERESPLERRKAGLSLEKAREQLLKAETDLLNMREIMDEEAEAGAKDEIIRRYEKSFEFAQENLAIETEEMAIEVESNLPAELLELAGAVRAAEAELQAEEIRAAKKRAESELAATKARHELDQAKRDQKKAKEAVAKARKKLESAPADAPEEDMSDGDGK
ncbi:hypothetical protein Poly30_24950 [Planctomycetes bacterium Poly30]|uniref:Chromosome partition protein Smc n=1 Tax=Saltatorellus ferox TaxID=2528018 RepID=A0A518ESB3_9BACT|nr:hypothetical protein Poly30_24950 [Planctomycetes bacterium Poly30]